eukprot:jgi/Mesvir1/22132/Mv18735-RA.1
MSADIGTARMKPTAFKRPAFYFQTKTPSPDEVFFPFVDPTVDSPFQFFTPTAERITHVRATPADGSCFFHAICLQRAMREGMTVTARDVARMSSNLRRRVRESSPMFLPSLPIYLREGVEETLKDREWAEEGTVWLTAKYLQTDIYVVGVHYEDRRPYFVWLKTPCGVPQGASNQPYILFWNGHDHFSCLVTESDVRSGRRAFSGGRLGPEPAPRRCMSV